MRSKFIWAILAVIAVAIGVWVALNSSRSSIVNQHSDLIVIDQPVFNQLVTSPLTVSGKARGMWYFEASFPVTLIDAHGAILAQAPAQAQGEWMTENFVPFSLSLPFNQPTTESGTLILEKDNPSGLAEHAASVRIPVRFVSSQPQPAAKSQFGNPITLYTNQAPRSATFTDTLRVELTQVNDSRCKPDVQCIWQGELSPVLHISGPVTAQQVQLGTVNNQSVVAAGYTFKLQSATEASATIVVTKSLAQESGIKGYVHVGPMCPVVQDPPDPNCDDRPYAVSIEIHYANERLFKIVRSDASGNFFVSAPAGTYIVRPQAANVLPFCPEQSVVVLNSKVTSIDIACDSGIR